MHYLDHNATSPLRPEALAAMERALAIGGNPSSVHAAGRAARAAVEEARERVAAFAGAKTDEVAFTAGGTEANALALHGAIAGALEGEDRITRLMVVATAHSSVRNMAASLAETVPGLKVSAIPVDANGRIEAGAFRLMLMNGKGRALVSLIAANNETGVIEDVAALSGVLRAECADALLHVDAVAAGYVPMNFAGVDYLSLSAHKIGGPQGAGALLAKAGAPLAPLVPGTHERGRRGGTENVSGIAGFAAAARVLQMNLDASIDHAKNLRDAFEAGLRRIAPDAVIFGEDAARAPNTSCFAIPGTSAETALMALDLDGVAVSSGSACSSGKVSPSHVLAAMGASEVLARCALRASFGWSSTKADVDAALASLEKLLERKLRLAVA